MNEIPPKYSQNMTTVTDVQQPDDYSKSRQQFRLNFSPEEAKVYQECMRSSNTVMPTIICAAMSYGLCSVTPFRAYAKYVGLVGGIIGLLGNRLHVTGICLAKVLLIPNSPFREKLIEASYLRADRPYRERLEYQDFQSVQKEVQSQTEPSTEIMKFDDYPPMNTYDTYSSINGSSDFHVSKDTDLTEPITLQKGVNYDELRRKNRDEYYKKNRQWLLTTPRESPKETTKQAPTNDNLSPMQGKTKYGDVWD